MRNSYLHSIDNNTLALNSIKMIRLTLKLRNCIRDEDPTCQVKILIDKLGSSTKKSEAVVNRQTIMRTTLVILKNW